ncbi:MAG: hypothetical protein Q9185_002952 [Variospora sp. 1 TL-2023]
MLFNNNDYFFGQKFHLAESHAVAEIVYLAALRTTSARYPVRAFLDRVMYQAYAVRPVGAQVLFNPGGFFGQGAAGNPSRYAGGGGPERFRAEMEAFSRQAESRRFNPEGLNKRCPSLWKVLDPRKIVFFLWV